MRDRFKLFTIKYMLIKYAVTTYFIRVLFQVNMPPISFSQSIIKHTAFFVSCRHLAQPLFAEFLFMKDNDQKL